MPLIPAVAKKVEKYIEKNAKALSQNGLSMTRSGGIGTISSGISMSIQNFSSALQDSISKLALSIKDLAKTIQETDIATLARKFHINIEKNSDVEEGIKADISRQIKAEAQEVATKESEAKMASGDGAKAHNDSLVLDKSENSKDDALSQNVDAEKIVAFFKNKTHEKTSNLKTSQETENASGSTQQNSDSICSESGKDLSDKIEVNADETKETIDSQNFENDFNQ